MPPVGYTHARRFRLRADMFGAGWRHARQDYVLTEVGRRVGKPRDVHDNHANTRRTAAWPRCRREDLPDRPTMKTMRGIAVCVVAALVSGCVATPNLLGEGTAGATPTQASSILIVVDGRMFDAPSFGKEGRAYLVGLGEGIQGALADVPTKVVELDVMKFVNPVPSALQAMSPSHTIRLFAESDMMRYGTPISATWQMEVSDVTTAPVPATNDKPGGTRYTIKPIYKARANGETCLDSDSLARKCGVAMGKMFGETLRAAHVVRIGTGT